MKTPITDASKSKSIIEIMSEHERIHNQKWFESQKALLRGTRLMPNGNRQGLYEYCMDNNGAKGVLISKPQIFTPEKNHSGSPLTPGKYKTMNKHNNFYGLSFKEVLGLLIDNYTNTEEFKKKQKQEFQRITLGLRHSPDKT